MVTIVHEAATRWPRRPPGRRVAAAGSGGAPHIVPVGFRLDAEAARIISWGIEGLAFSEAGRSARSVANA
jgi:hypothetical protein